MLKWTREQPVEPGWYWFRANDPHRAPVVVEVARHATGMLMARRVQGQIIPPWLLEGWWAGPIPEPMPPEWVARAPEGEGEDD